MPKAFLVRKRLSSGGPWSPVTPPPSPDELNDSMLMKSLKEPAPAHQASLVRLETADTTSYVLNLSKSADEHHASSSSSSSNSAHQHSSSKMIKLDLSPPALIECSPVDLSNKKSGSLNGTHHAHFNNHHLSQVGGYNVRECYPSHKESNFMPSSLSSSLNNSTSPLFAVAAAAAAAAAATAVAFAAAVAAAAATAAAHEVPSA